MRWYINADPMSLDLQGKHTMKQVRLQSVIIFQTHSTHTAKDTSDVIRIEKAHSLS